MVQIINPLVVSHTEYIEVPPPYSYIFSNCGTGGLESEC